MTDERIAAIEARLAEATPGPWQRVTYGHKDTRSQVRAAGKALRRTTAWLRESTGSPDIEATDLTWVEYEHGSISLVGNGPRQTENGDFIACAREDIPWLLARLREVEQERDRLAEALRGVVYGKDGGGGGQTEFAYGQDVLAAHEAAK